MARIAVTDGMSEDAVLLLRKAGHEVDLLNGIKSVDKSERKYSKDNLLNGYDAVVIRSATKLTADVIASSPSLKLIGRAGVGVDNIDLEAASEAGILVCNTPTSSTQSVVELTIAHLLASVRFIPLANSDLRDGKWSKSKLKGTELSGKRLGFIGFGRIAQGVGRVAKALGMELHAYDPYVSIESASELDCKLYEDVKQVFRNCTHIAVHCNLTDKTHHLVNLEMLSLMPGVGADGIECGNHLVSCARGGIVNEDDALHALEKGILNSCALDVFEKEPETSHPILKHNNFHGTPHIGASTYEAQIRIGLEMAGLIIDFFNGLTPKSLINRNVLN